MLLNIAFNHKKDILSQLFAAFLRLETHCLKARKGMSYICFRFSKGTIFSSVVLAYLLLII